MINVLLVEDEQWLGDLYLDLLQQAGCNVTWAQDGYDAYDIAAQATPDIIVLDIMLPRANGLQLLNAFASISALSAVPVIICTSALPKGISADYLKAYGVVAVLDKTNMKPSNLINKVKEFACKPSKPKQ